jgi:hypothetical protein
MITADVTLMFQGSEPWDCSNSVANLGDQAGRLTWESAKDVVGADVPAWLLCPHADACEEMRQWCKETGAWDREEIADMSDATLLGIFVQNVASELRMLGSDDHELDECAHVYASTDWDSECEYPTGSYYFDDDTGHVCVQWSAM